MAAPTAATGTSLGARETRFSSSSEDKNGDALAWATSARALRRGAAAEARHPPRARRA
ncbi:hypothetical protein NKG05_24240 [Oerskovia sp. M15]